MIADGQSSQTLTNSLLSGSTIVYIELCMEAQPTGVKCGTRMLLFLKKI
jgi:hypothetical protein